MYVEVGVETIIISWYLYNPYVYALYYINYTLIVVTSNIFIMYIITVICPNFNNIYSLVVLSYIIVLPMLI